MGSNDCSVRKVVIVYQKETPKRQFGDRQMPPKLCGSAIDGRWVEILLGVVGSKAGRWNSTMTLALGDPEGTMRMQMQAQPGKRLAHKTMKTTQV